MKTLRGNCVAVASSKAKIVWQDVLFDGFTTNFLFDIMALSDKIRAIRKSKGIKACFVANKLNMERGNYCHLENRNTDKVYYYDLLIICDALNVSLEYLLNYELSVSP